MASPKPVTKLLRRWQKGDRRALDELTPLVYSELKRLARRSMRSESAGHTLQATALVNEAYLKLVDADVDWKDRAHFFAMAARLMRRLLVDHARARLADKRGGGRTHLELDERVHGAGRAEADLLEVDDLLEKLASFDERKAGMIELHYFAGLTYEEIAEAMSVSPVTVHRDLKVAKAWLQKEMRAP